MVTREQQCPGCGQVSAESDGPRHPYIGASASCWVTYGHLLAVTGPDQDVVDAYAAQHPGVPGRRARQSVALHLVSLCAALERGAPSGRRIGLISTALASGRSYPWLPLECPVGSVTVREVLADPSLRTQWARDVWSAWSVHHPTVRGWLDELS